MGFFDKLQKPGQTALKQEKHASHTEKRMNAVVSNKSTFMHPIHQRPQKAYLKHQPKSRATSANGVKRSSPMPTASSREKQQHIRKSASVTPQQQWGSESDISDQDLDGARKRQRRQSTVEPDNTRTIPSRKAFSQEDAGQFSMVHAADIANLTKLNEYELAFPDFPEIKDIDLQYPSASQREKYELVIPRAKDDFRSLVETREVIEMITAYYLPSEVAETITNDSTGLIRRLKRASQRLAGSEYVDHIHEWNNLLTKLRENGILLEVIREWKMVDLRLCEFILTQTYARTVSLEVSTLKKYKNGDDYVYGELLPRFVSTILKKDVKMKADQVFLDLGSGVGNVVLQAALEVGCESWGCEKMPNACKLAELQKKEFEARCRLWGIAKGEIHLETGDFLANEAIRQVLQRADVVLVNNQAFTPELNEGLTNLFLDLKEGAKVVSLKSFAPIGQQNQSRSAGAIYNILDVTEKTYYDLCVSWTNASGTYYVATKDSTRVKNFS